MTEHQRQNLEVSPVVQQALGKLNVRMADLMEQINVVIKVLVEENARVTNKTCQHTSTATTAVKRVDVKIDKHSFSFLSRKNLKVLTHREKCWYNGFQRPVNVKNWIHRKLCQAFIRKMRTEFWLGIAVNIFR
jgi:hypothetical protein